MTRSPNAPPGAGLPGLVDAARSDLAHRLGVSADAVTVLEAARVTWADASLGCPEQGMQYAQVLTPGYLIRLEAGGQEYEYHAGQGTALVTCEDPAAPVPGTPPDV